MNTLKKYFIFIALGGLISCCCGASVAQAQANYYNAGEADTPAATEEAPPPLQTFTVTSISKCYAALSRADALDIQRNFIKPYQECQRRLALQLKKKQQQQSKDGAAKDKPAETPASAPQGFYRVQKSASPPSADADEKKPAVKDDPAPPAEKSPPPEDKPWRYN